MTNEEQIKKWKKQLEEYDKKRVAELNEIRSTPSVPISNRNKDADTSNFFGGLLGGLLPGSSIADVAIKKLREDQTLQQEAKKQGIGLNNLYTTQENLNMFGADVGRTIEATGAGISSSLSNLGKGTLLLARDMGGVTALADKLTNEYRNKSDSELEEIAKKANISTQTLKDYVSKAKTSYENINDFSANTFDKWSNEANQRIVELQGETENDFAKKAIGFMPNISQQAVTIGASLVNPVLGTYVASGQAKGSYFNDAKQRGMTDEQANDYSSLMSGFEGVTEMIGIGKMIKAGKGAKALVKGGLKSARKELSKEVITSTFGNLLGGAMDNFMQEAITEPIQEGVADWIGGKGNWENIDERMLKAGINGALTSLITGGANIGVQSAVGLASKTRNGQNVTQQEVNQGLVDTLAEIDKLSKEEKQEFIDKYVTPGIETAQDVVKNELNQVPTEPNRAVPMQTSENAQQQVQEQEQQVISNQNENALNQNVEPQNLVESAERSGIDVKDENTRKNLEVIQKFNENRGIKATFDADAFKGHDNINSFFRTDENGNREIVFNPNTMTDKTIQQLAVHEVYHDMVAGGTAQELTDFVVQKMSNNPEYQEYVRALQDVYEEQDSDIIKEEAVAHYLEKNLGTDEFISELQQRGDRTTIQRIIDTIKDMITKAKNTLTGKGDLNYLLDLQRKYEQAYKGEFKGTQEQTKLSKQVNNLSQDILSDTNSKQGNAESEFFKERTTDYDKRQGYSEDGKTKVIRLQKGDNEAKVTLTENKDKIWIDELYVKNRKQGYGKEIVDAIKKYAYNNDKEIETFKEVGSAKEFWDKMFGEDTYKYGTHKYSKYRPEYWQNKIDDIQRDIDNEIKLQKEQPEYYDFYQDRIDFKNRNLEKYKTNLEESIKAQDNIQDNVRYSKEAPTQDNQGRELSKGQQEYFKNSVARDKDGNLKTLYHGTTADFSVFNYDNLGKNGTANGKGFYLADDKNVAKAFSDGSDRIKTVYANIEKPLKIGETTMSADEYTRFAEAINDKTNGLLFADRGDGEPIQKNSKQYQEILDDLKQDYEYGGDDVDLVNSILNGANISLEDGYRVLKDTIGYDGIIAKSSYNDDNGNKKTYTQYIPLTPEQIKNVDNTNPTTNPDIRLDTQGTGTSQEIINNFLENTKVNEGTGTAIKDLARVQEETTEPVRQVAPSEAPAQVPQVNEVKQRQVEPIRDITDVERPQVPQNQKVRKTYESIINSNQMTQEAKQIAKELMGYDTYVPQTNEFTLAVADRNIKQNGVDESLTSLTNKINNNDRVNAVDIATGERLIEYYSKIGDRQKLQEAIQSTAMAGTEAGRAVQAMSMINHQTPIGQVTWIQRSVDKVNKRLAKEGKKAQFNFTPEMQQKILNSTSENLQQNLNEVYQELGKQVPKSNMEKFNEWRYFSMLANPKTHIRNILGNTVMKAVQNMKNKVAGTIEDFVIGDNAERWNSLKGASKGMYEFAKNDLKNADVQSMLGLNENKYNPQSRLQQNQRTFKSDLLEKTLGKAFELNSKALEVEDGWGLKSGYAKAMTNYLNANKLDYNNLTDVQLQKARQYAVQQAKEATFHQENTVANMLQTLENKNLFTKVALGGAIPFKKTPMNVALTGFEYSPAGFVKTLTSDLSNLKKGKISTNQFIDNIAKNLTGTGIAVVGYGLTQAGILKASGSGDEDKDEFEEATGKQNYSIQIGDKTYSLDWLTPAGIPLFIGSELYQVSHQKEDGNKTKNENEAFKSITNILDATASAMNPMSEMTMISGLTDALKSYAQGSTKSIENMLANVGKSYVTQTVPTALGQIARSTDQYERSTTSTETDPMAKAIDSAKNQIISKIPGLRETLPVSTDVWGNERETQSYEENAILPWTSKEISKDPVNKALTDLYDATGESGVLPDNYIDKSLTIDKEKYKLTNEEYARLKQQYGKTAHDILSDLTNSKEYEQMSDEQKVKAVKEAYSYAKSTLKVTYSDENNLDAEESSTYKKVQSVIDNGGDAKEYFEYTGLIDGVKKEKEKRQILLNSNLKDKGAIYESTIGSDDETYQIMKATGIDPDAYLDYKQQDFSSDKEDDGTVKGKTVSGSGKTKFYDYMDNADMTYEQKLLLTGMKYKLLPGERDTLANYIDTLPISASEKTDIYRHLKGAKVYDNGEIYY